MKFYLAWDVQIQVCYHDGTVLYTERQWLVYIRFSDWSDKNKTQ